MGIFYKAALSSEGADLLYRLCVALEQIRPGSAREFNSIAPGASTRAWLNDFLGVDMPNAEVLTFLRRATKEAERVADTKNIILTTSAHGYRVGDEIEIADTRRWYVRVWHFIIRRKPPVRGRFIITSASESTFTLDDK